MRAVWGSEVGGNGIGPAAIGVDLRDDGLRLIGAATVVDDDAGPRGGSAKAAARPMPREAPVTRAVLLVRSVMAFSFVMWAKP